MFDTSIYSQRNFGQGLRSLTKTIGDVIEAQPVKQAAARIQAGENQQAVISELMAQSPQAAQQLMNLIGGQMNVDAAGQELAALKQKVGVEVMQGAAMPLFMALQSNDDKTRAEFIKQGASIFQGRDDTAASVLNEMAGLKGKQQFDALAGTVKALQQAGVFPQDPSQMLGQGTALGQNLALYDQAIAAGDTERAEIIKRNLDPYSRSLSGGIGAGEARLMTEQGLNPLLAQREAAKIQATEGTATGQAQLAQEQQAVAKGEREVAESARAKENAVASINQQLQQVGVLRGHKGFESAVGKSSYFPSIRGSEAFNFERQLEKFDAQSFLAQVPSMVGMGALSNAEGAKVSASASALHVGMSEEEFKKELDTIEEVLKQGRERIRTGNLLKPEQQTQKAPSTVGRFKIEVE